MDSQSRMSGSRPNILFVLADDLSYRDLSSFGQVQFETPTWIVYAGRVCASITLIAVRRNALLHEAV